LDDFPSDFSWELRTYPDDTMVWNITNYTEGRTLIVEQACIPTNGCYRFVVYDSFGDGVCCFYGEGKVHGFLDGEQVFVLGKYGLSASFVFGSCPSIGATCESSGLHNFSVALAFDFRPSETSWMVYSGLNYMGGRDYSEHILFQQDGVALDVACLPEDRCYRFVISDDGHSGICCSRWENGTVSGFLDGEKIYDSDGQFGAGETVFFSTFNESGSTGDPCNQTCESRGEGTVTVRVQVDADLSFPRFGLGESWANYKVFHGAQLLYVKDFHNVPHPQWTVEDRFCLPLGYCYEGHVMDAGFGSCEVHWNGRHVYSCDIPMHPKNVVNRHPFGNCTGLENGP